MHYPDTELLTWWWLRGGSVVAPGSPSPTTKESGSRGSNSSPRTGFCQDACPASIFRGHPSHAPFISNDVLLAFIVLLTETRGRRCSARRQPPGTLRPPPPGSGEACPWSPVRVGGCSSRRPASRRSACSRGR